jgi:hypothetical protein
MFSLNLPPWNNGLVGSYAHYNLNHIGEGFHTEKAWWLRKAVIPYLNNDLIDLVKKYPLTKDFVSVFYNYCIGTTYNIGSLTCIHPSTIPFKFIIFLEENLSEEKRAEYLIHEITHGVYRSIGGKYEENERVVDEEGLRFYNQNTKFSLDLSKVFVNNQI